MNALAPPPERAGAVRVAIGTHSGVRVSEHFGQATRFEIWEVTPDGARLVETRVNRPACGSGGDDRAEALMDASVATVADCRAVVVARIGECALSRLDKLGVLAFESEDPVDATLRELANYAALFERRTA
jgi:predicted Fe-Mo cluster-binding NifX family protein